MCDFETLFNSHPVPTWVYSVSSHRFLAVNDAMVSCYGYTREELLQMTVEQIRPAEDVSDLLDHLKSSESYRRSPSTWRHLRKDGATLDVEVESTQLMFRGEAARLTTARNVTGQLNMLEKFQLALSAGRFALWEYNIASGVLHWDPNQSGIYGIDRKLFPTNKAQFLELVAPEFRESLDDAFDKCVRDGVPYDQEFMILMPGIGMRWRHAVGRRIDDRSGIPVKIIGVGVDVTEKKRLEEQIHRSQKLEAVGRLASGIAHDFNNLLTVISGYAHLMKAEPLSSFLLNAVMEIDVTSDRAARLVRQLLDFSRTAPVDPELVDVNVLASNILALVARLLPENILMNVDRPEVSIRIRADPGQIEQLLMNLCLNARDAMVHGGRLSVRVSNIGDEYVCFAVSDTGTGILPEVQERMFEPFFTTKEVGSGIGLGLSIVHGIVSQLRGTIEVDSAQGRGSTFIVKLPLAGATDECRSPHLRNE